jgi:hypothetical protein
MHVSLEFSRLLLFCFRSFFLYIYGLQGNLSFGGTIPRAKSGISLKGPLGATKAELKQRRLWREVDEARGSSQAAEAWEKEVECLGAESDGQVI